MKRFIFLFVLGALMIVGGQVSLSLGLHPQRLASLRVLAQGSLVLILGAAVTAAGMLGLAETYGKIAVRMTQLLSTKEQDEHLELTVRDRADLDGHNRGFWKAYARSAGAVCLFLAGFLGLSVFFASCGFLLYLAGLGGGFTALGGLSLLLGSRALCALYRTHRTVENSALILATQPDRPAERQERSKPETGWTFRRRPPLRYSRYLDHRRHSSAHC